MTKHSVYLKCSSINSNVAVNMQCTTYTLQFNNNVDSKENTGTFNSTLGQSVVAVTGFTNATMTLNGQLNVSGTNSISYTLLKQFIQEVTNPIYIDDGTLFFLVDPQKVQVLNCTINRRASDDNTENRIDYSLTLVFTL